MSDDLVISQKAFSGKNWSREQVMIAFYFYCQTPFGQLHGRNKKVIELAELIGRTPDAVAMKCTNIASLDPAILASGRVGLGNASKLDREIWNEFHADWERLTIECEGFIQFLRREHGQKPAIQPEASDNFVLSDYTGQTRQALIQQRIKQDFFRRAVLSSYGGRCCISGVSDARLLIASHIVSWKEDKANRLNPSNGLCLSSIHDKAFDQHLFSLSDDRRVVLSKQLERTKDRFLQEVFWPTQDRPVAAPERFRPEADFLRRHREKMLEADV